MKIECSLISDVGILRQNNEDNFYLNGKYRSDVNQEHIEMKELSEDEAVLGAVFDGMGGEDYGELASLEAAKCLGDYQNQDFQKIYLEYVHQANEAVCNMMCSEGFGRMGSTLSVVRIADSMLSLCNVGDSPVFLFRNNQLKQLSVSHNEAQRLFDMGMISEDELRSNRKRHWLTQHLGILKEEMVIEPFVMENVQLQKQDYILLCSDGLTDMVDVRDISCVLQEKVDVYQKTKELIDMALDNGGRDNITVMLVCILDV